MPASLRICTPLDLAVVVSPDRPLPATTMVMFPDLGFSQLLDAEDADAIGAGRVRVVHFLNVVTEAHDV